MPYDGECADIVVRLRDEVEALGLPLLQAPRPLAIINALEINVEEGCTNQEAVGFLFQALTAEVQSWPEPARNRAMTAINGCRGALALRAVKQE
jgi:hypothetical protein